MKILKRIIPLFLVILICDGCQHKLSEEEIAMEKTYQIQLNEIMDVPIRRFNYGLMSIYEIVNDHTEPERAKSYKLYNDTLSKELDRVLVTLNYISTQIINVDNLNNKDEWPKMSDLKFNPQKKDWIQLKKIEKLQDDILRLNSVYLYLDSLDFFRRTNPWEKNQGNAARYNHYKNRYEYKDILKRQSIIDSTFNKDRIFQKMRYKNNFEALNAVKLLKSIFSREYAFLLDGLYTSPGCFNYDYDEIEIIVNSDAIFFENDSISLEFWPSYIFANSPMQLEILNIDGVSIAGSRRAYFKTKLPKGIHKIEGRLGRTNKNGELRWKSFEKEIYVHSKEEELNQPLK